MPRQPLPTRTKIIAGVLLLIPIVVPLLVWTYSSEKPRLWGFPFFYWYQLLWVFIAAGFTYAAYVVVERSRGDR